MISCDVIGRTARVIEEGHRRFDQEGTIVKVFDLTALMAFGDGPDYDYICLSRLMIRGLDHKPTQAPGEWQDGYGGFDRRV